MIKSWGLKLAKRSCHRKATIAVARKLGVVMHAMWRHGTFYIGDAAATKADIAKRAAIKNSKLLGAHVRA
jgi:transposase